MLLMIGSLILGINGFVRCGRQIRSAMSISMTFASIFVRAGVGWWTYKSSEIFVFIVVLELHFVALRGIHKPDVQKCPGQREAKLKPPSCRVADTSKDIFQGAEPH